MAHNRPKNFIYLFFGLLFLLYYNLDSIFLKTFTLLPLEEMRFFFTKTVKKIQETALKKTAN